MPKNWQKEQADHFVVEMTTLTISKTSLSQNTYQLRY